MKQMLDAIKDWVKNQIKRIKEDMGKLEEKIDIDTLLRKTGDAGKTRVKAADKYFYYDPTFTNGYENLEDILGTIIKAMKNMDYRVYHQSLLMSSLRFVSEDALDGAFEEWIEGGSEYPDKDKVLLIYGKGGAVNENGRLTSDFYRVYMVFYKDPPSSATYPCGRVLVQLGSVGSTARWSLAVTLTSATNSSLPSLVLKIPKGSWAEVGYAKLNL